MMSDKLEFLKVEEVDKDGWYLADGNWYNPKMVDVYILKK